jgi:Cu2+-exporting ATPase
VDACTHCGLPLGRRPLTATVEGAVGRFCCFGCVLAQQVTRAHGDDGHAAAILVRIGIAIFFAMNVMMVSLPTYVPAFYGSSGVAVDGPLFVVLRWLAMLLAAPVLVLLGVPVLTTGLRNVARGVVGADALVVLGAGAAYALSVANTVQGRPEVYYDTAAMLLVLMTIGRYLEARARADAGAIVRRTLAAGPARALREEDGGARRAVDGTVLAPGDVVIVTPGEAFVTDGIVLGGSGGVDEAALTGESRAVAKHPGAVVSGGAYSIDGTFRVRVTAPMAESATARIAAQVESALATRGPTQRLADAVAGALVPVVIVAALGAGAWWGVTAGIDRGVLVALAVLVVACPCGLGIATPLAVWSGLAAAARRGVVVRSAPVLERIAGLRTVFFDKTGTLTESTPRVLGVEPMNARPDDVLAIAAALEHEVRHPVARAIVRAAAERGLVAPPATDVEVVPGRGVRGRVDGRAVSVGSATFAAESGGGAAFVDDPALAVTVVCDGVVQGVIRVDETLAAGARSAIGDLRALGLRIGVLTGDTQARAVGALVTAREIATGLRPDEKLERVRAARGDGAVAMVGDGFNDAPALAAADVGIALATAPDLARVTADVVVLGGPADVAWLVAHARRVVRIARQGLRWAFAYNAVAVALAIAGRLDPLIAAVAMLASSLGVVANARRAAGSPPTATRDADGIPVLARAT